MCMGIALRDADGTASLELAFPEAKPGCPALDQGGCSHSLSDNAVLAADLISHSNFDVSVVTPVSQTS